MAVTEKKVRSNLPVYSVGAVWAGYALFFDLYRWTDYLIAGALSAVVFLLLSKVVPDKTIRVTEPDFEKSGDKTADALLDQGNKMLNELLVIRAAVRQPALKDSITALHKTGSDIYGYLSKNPSATGAINKFHDYYFPETLKILRAYDEIDDFGEGGNVASAKEMIEKAVAAMTAAFRKQLDNLLYDKTFDVRADIKVLETILSEEGLDK